MKYMIIAIVLNTSVFANNFSENHQSKNNLVNIFTGEQIGQYFQFPE